MGKTMTLKGLCSIAAIAAATTAFTCGAAAQSPPPVIALPAPPPPPRLEPSLPKGTPVRIDFAPPLGVPIRYRSAETKTVDGERKTTAVELVVRFERSGDAWVMEGRIEMPGLPPGIAANPMVRIAMRPIRFRLDRDGGFVGIEDEDAYWAGLEPIIDQLVREPGNTPESVALIRGMFRRMREMPADERAALVGRKFVPITAYANLDLAVGDTVETPVEEASSALPIPDSKLRRAFVVTLASASASRARIETETRFDREDMARFMRQLADLAPKGKRPAELPAIDQSFVHVVSRDTGLVLSSTETNRAVGDGAGVPAIKIVTLQRLP